MQCTYKQAARFFRLFDQLTMYAHERLHVVSDAEFYNGEPPRGIGEMGQRETSLELWNNPQIIEDFARENPANLSEEDLRTVATWSNAYSNAFYVTKQPSGELLFNNGVYGFEVCGLSKRIERMLHQVPGMVKMTLLPYDDVIVYGQYILELPLLMDEHLRKLAVEGEQTVLSQNHVAKTGDDLCSIAPLLKRQKEERELEEFRYDMEMEERAQGELPGQHKGALVGMDNQDRERAIRDHINELDEIDGHLDTLRNLDLVRAIEDCMPGEPTDVLEDLLRADDPDLASKQLQDEVKFFSDEQSLERFVRRGTEIWVKRVRRLVEAGGRMSFSKDDPEQTKRIPTYEYGMTYLFDEGDAIVAVMPREVLAAARQLDWDGIEAHVSRCRQLTRYMDVATQLRGLVRVEDVLDEYFEQVDDPLEDASGMVDALQDALFHDQANYCLLAADDVMYAMHFLLFWEYQKLRGEDPYENRYATGELGELLEGLLRRHKGKEPRPITDEMLSCESMYEWEMQQPPVIAARDFFDAHVPDDADDYFFADKVLEELLDEVRWGMVKGSMDAFFDILDQNGFVPDESQVKPLINLWQNLCNGMPIWPNNGWSPNELLSRSTGRRVFYNPDGSMMKVGRNDPCPCGSGKKYKRCHGRPQ